METLNVGSDSSDLRAVALSNFPAYPFVLDDENFASVEGFVQGIKWPKGDERRRNAFGLSGLRAKRLGRGAERTRVWWKGRAIAFGSPEHHALIERAIRAKYEQNPEARDLLIATDGLELVHDLGYPESAHTSLPAAVFCDILTRIRAEELARNPIPTEVP